MQGAANPVVAASRMGGVASYSASKIRWSELCVIAGCSMQYREKAILTHAHRYMK